MASRLLQHREGPWTLQVDVARYASGTVLVRAVDRRAAGRADRGVVDFGPINWTPSTGWDFSPLRSATAAPAYVRDRLASLIRKLPAPSRDAGDQLSAKASASVQKGLVRLQSGRACQVVKIDRKAGTAVIKSDGMEPTTVPLSKIAGMDPAWVTSASSGWA